MNALHNHYAPHAQILPQQYCTSRIPTHYFPIQSLLLQVQIRPSNTKHCALCLCTHHYTYFRCQSAQCCSALTLGGIRQYHHSVHNHLCTNSRCTIFFQLVKQAATECHWKEALLHSFLISFLSLL